MKLAYHEEWKCTCGELFILFIPLYIVLFRSWQFREADRQYQFAILKHNVKHMEDKWHAGRTQRVKAKHY